jgi:hypothetical protein
MVFLKRSSLRQDLQDRQDSFVSLFASPEERQKTQSGFAGGKAGQPRTDPGEISSAFHRAGTDTGQDHLDRIYRIIRIFFWLLLFPEEKVANQSGFAGVKNWRSFRLRMRWKNIGEVARP